jgi:mono/diheme cytochrome c family protein
MRALATAGCLLVLCSSASLAIDEGEYLFNAAGCEACHTAKNGASLAGGRPFESEFGTFFSPNITPDREHGIGEWSKRDFVDAVKHGRAPDGSAYFPVFPYPSYRNMTDADAGRLFDYLQTRKPIAQANREHRLPWWVHRWMMHPWQWWLLEEPLVPPPGETAEIARGRYLVDALGHCAECHSPRNRVGVSDRSRYLAGSRTGPDNDAVPNITPHREQGIGKWSADDLEYFLETGELPNGDYTGGHMVDVIDHGTSRLTAEDRRAMTLYLRSVMALPGP